MMRKEDDEKETAIKAIHLAFTWTLSCHEFSRSSIILLSPECSYQCPITPTFYVTATASTLCHVGSIKDALTGVNLLRLGAQRGHQRFSTARIGSLTRVRFNKLPSRTKLQTACEQGSLWLIECSLNILNIQYYKTH